MFHTPVRLFAALALAAATLSVMPATSTAAPIPLKGQAMITKTDKGYLLRAGQQDSHLTITRQPNGNLRFVDTHTRSWRSLAGACHRISVPHGVGAVCPVPAKFGKRNPIKLELWMRLGDDYIDARSLPHLVKLSVLADAGRDEIHAGDGNDFVNGAQDGDRIWGGKGHDWIRTGIGNDHIHGGPGSDRLVGVEGADSVNGGPGNDRVEGGPGNDDVWGNDGRDVVSCGTGRDHGHGDRRDKFSQCESIQR